MSIFSYDPNDNSVIESCILDHCDLNSASAEDIFPVESKWKDRKLLYTTVQAYAAATGWKAALSHSIYIKCSCYDRPIRSNNTRKFSSGSLCKSCKWEIKIRSTENESKLIKTGISKGRYKSFPIVKDGVNIIISKANLEHTGDCQPSRLQQVMQRSRSGAYVKNISDVSLYTLCTMLKDEGKLSSSFIKQVLKTQFPANKNVTNKHVYWMKNRIKTIMPRMHNCDSFNDFQDMFKTSRLHVGVDDIPLTDDNIAQMGKELWLEIMNDDNCEDSILTFQEYMLSLEANNKGFSVTLLKSAETGRLTGCIWQTAIMRDNFERFGGFLSMDAMLRPINEMEWPYMSISMYNELNSVCVACEGIVCGERVEAYKAMIDFVLENNTKRTRHDIDVVAADGVLDQDKVTNTLGLPNAIFMADVYHLLDSVLPKKFGTECFNLIQSNIKQMIYSNTKEDFDNNYIKALELLRLRDKRHAKHETALREFESDKNSYASYILRTKKGTRGKHGSSISEINHSSILVHLNEGLKHGNHYSEKPHTLVKDLFVRQEKHIVRWNQQIYNEFNDLLLMRSKINKNSDPHLYRASEVLCLTSFKHFQDRMEKARYYSKQMTSQTNVTIRSLKHPTAPPRECYRTDVKCFFTCSSCESSIAREEQCVHSIVANDNVFIPEQFAIHHFRRKFVSGSYMCMNIDEDNEFTSNNMNSIEASNNELSDDEDHNNYHEDRTADIGFNEQDSGAAFYEQLPSENQNIKCLSESDLKKVMDQILGKYSSCNENVKKKINAIMLSLNEMSITNGNVNGVFDLNDETDKEIHADMIDKMIRDHRNSFLATKNNFTSNRIEDIQILRPSLSQMQRKKKILRIMSNRHKSLKKAKRYQNMSRLQCSLVQKTPKKIPACRFCGSTEPGERLSSCQKRANLQGYTTEYILGSNQNGLFNFVTKIEHSTVFVKDSPVPTNIITVGENSKSRHFFVHRVWSTSDNQSSKVNIDDLIFEFSYIDKRGEVETLKNQILGKALYSMLVACNLKKGPFFVYDKTPFKTFNDEEQTKINDFSNNMMNRNPQNGGFLEHCTGNSLSQFSYLTQMSQNSCLQLSEFNNNVRTDIHTRDYVLPMGNHFQEQNSYISQENQQMYIANL